MLNASLDIFDLRARDRNRVDQDLGLLHAVDERLSVWGWETGTGTRFAVVLDMWGREGKEAVGLGLKEGELKPVRWLSGPLAGPRITGNARGRIVLMECLLGGR